MNAKTQNTIAVIIGILAVFAMGALFVPVMNKALSNVFTFSMEKGFSLRGGFYVFEFLLVAIPSFIGGFITCWIAIGRKIFAALLMGLFTFLLLVVWGSTDGQLDLSSTLTLLTIIPLALMGGIVRQIIENKNEIENY